jgi:hypothetical protein
MQYIIEEVGMSGQMLNQMSNKTGFSYVSHVDFNGDSFNRRFELIKDEVNRLRMIPACYMTNLNNIEVICDLNSDESLGWAFHGDEVNHTK